LLVTQWKLLHDLANHALRRLSMNLKH
jgi:hypothetical protein